MFVSKLKTLAMALLTISAIGVGSGAIALHRSTQAADGEQVTQASPQDQKSESSQQDKPLANSLRETREIVPADAKDAKVADVLFLTFSPDGKRLASVNAAGGATIWEVSSRKTGSASGGPPGGV